MHPTDGKPIGLDGASHSAEKRGSPSAFRIMFDPFELNVTERSLRKAGEVIPLGGRAFDILLALVDRAGEVVSNSELMAKVWPNVMVGEISLRVHLSMLRKALRDGGCGRRYIANVKGRGYCFMAPVTRRAAEDHDTSLFVRSSNLPPALSRMIGRDDAVLEIGSRLRTERFITILGVGGIGKTTVALAVGHAALADFGDAVFFVDLSTVKDKEQVVSAIASAIGHAAQFANPEDALLNFLCRRKALLLLDSCEHLIEKAAEVADRIFQFASDIHVLATSREALQTGGEHVFRLPSLDCPPEQPRQTAAEVLSYPAARLFVERVKARGNDFSLGNDEAPLVAEICRKLDGIALAIELAAGRAALFGVKDIATRLGSRLDLLKFGRRTANPRHQTLSATLDWSHDLLSEVERVVLRRMAIFRGRFTLEAALAVAEEKGTGQTDVTDAIGSLVNKSLIEPRIDSREASYRLLDTTRSYAFEKLVGSNDYEFVAARHANFSIQLLEANGPDLFKLRSAEAVPNSLQDYLGNVRAALEWSFGPSGCDRTALRLAAAAAQLFLSMSLFLECRNWMEKAINRITSDCDPQYQIEIHASFASSLMFIEGDSKRVRDAFDTALNFAQRYEDARQQLRLIVALSIYSLRMVDVAGTLEFALRSEVVAKKTGNPDDAAIADSLLGAAYYLLGDHVRSQKYSERVLRSRSGFRPFNASQYSFDPRSLALVCTSRSQWFTGKVDQALRYAEMAIEEAEKSGRMIALCGTLIQTMAIYFWVDNLEQVERRLSRLELTAEKQSLEPFDAVALGFKGRYLIRTGQTSDGIQHLRDSLEKLATQRYEIHVPDLVPALALCLAEQNSRAEAVALLDKSIAVQVEANAALYLPALFLAKGQALASGDKPDTPSAEEGFEKAMTFARQQSALSFELRAGLELAHIWIERGEVQRAQDLIGPIYGQFTEGFSTPDLVLAKEMLKGKSARVELARL
ncbi:ATP-binding protein [Bradyrhizobium sp. AZCC 2289]|uniref:ATP-binding protein n=1 Tax=Bradyrhizobium sp. AZCC 2289 TaxID=3117026 RepID=UPI002FEF49AC